MRVDRIFIYLPLFIWLLAIVAGCGKTEVPPSTNPPTNPPANPPTTPPKTCTLTGMIQQNSGGKPDFALSLTFNGTNPAKLVVFDSLGNKKILESIFSFASTDSIRLDQYQYFKLDGSKRVIVFETLSDMSIPTTADHYRYEYSYNRNGELSSKKLFVNKSGTPFYTSTYTYTSGLLTKCVVVADGNSNWKVLESDITYDNNTTAKGWIYTIPDAFESNLYSSVLNFGTKPNRPLSKVVTKVLNPTNGNVLDTWTTNYGSYVLTADGYIQSGTASGDLQQGMAAFFGKTLFTYQCQ